MRGQGLAAALICLSLWENPAARAAAPHLPPLNPPPPAFETCGATGDGVICRGAQDGSFEEFVPLGLFCGTAANPVELQIGHFSQSDEFTRYYNTADDLVRRTLHGHSAGTVLNPATGLTALATQVAATTDIPAVPGDLSTATSQARGVVQLRMPGGGVLLRDVGREVIGSDGNDIVASGVHQLGMYFSGDHVLSWGRCVPRSAPQERRSPPAPKGEWSCTG
jgi:hypothetical protein